jgi:hypothetical protein
LTTKDVAYSLLNFNIMMQGGVFAMKSLYNHKLKVRLVIFNLFLGLSSMGHANELSDDLKNIQIGQCTYKGQIQGDITKSKFGASKFNGNVEVSTSVKKQGDQAILQFKLSSEAKVIELGAKMFMTIEEKSQYNMEQGSLSNLEVKTLIKAKKFFIEKVIKNNFIKAKFNQNKDSLNNESNMMVLESSKGNYSQVLPHLGFASVTFPLFHLSKLTQLGETKKIPVIKFNNVSNVYLPEVIDQALTFSLTAPTKTNQISILSESSEDAQLSAGKAHPAISTPLFLYGLNTHEPVEIVVDPETHKFKQIKMKLIFEVIGTKKEPLDFYIVANLNSENCKTDMKAQEAELDDSDSENSDN